MKLLPTLITLSSLLSKQCLHLSIAWCYARAQRFVLGAGRAAGEQTILKQCTLDFNIDVILENTLQWLEPDILLQHYIDVLEQQMIDGLD